MCLHLGGMLEDVFYIEIEKEDFGHQLEGKYQENKVATHRSW